MEFEVQYEYTGIDRNQLSLYMNSKEQIEHFSYLKIDLEPGIHLTELYTELQEDVSQLVRTNNIDFCVESQTTKKDLHIESRSYFKEWKN